MIPDEIFNYMNEEVANKIAEDLDSGDVPKGRGDAQWAERAKYWKYVNMLG